MVGVTPLASDIYSEVRAEMFNRLSQTLIVSSLIAVVVSAIGDEAVSAIVAGIMACVAIYALIRMLRMWD